MTPGGEQAAGPSGAEWPQAGPPFPPAIKPATDPPAPEPGQASPGTFSRAARTESPQVTGVPPWEITDSFLAVPAAEPSATAPTGSDQQSPPLPGALPRRNAGAGTASTETTAGPGDAPGESTLSFPAADSRSGRRLFPPLPSGDSPASPPADPPGDGHDDMEAFRLFPRGNGADDRQAAPEDRA